MYLKEEGKIVFEDWIKTAEIRPNVFLDDWIVMPNHIHGILEIREITDRVETHCNVSLPHDHESSKNTFGPQRNNLSSIIRGFKGAAKKRINMQFGQNYFSWQPKFYDHIVRNEDDHIRIRKYIAENPDKWEFDRNNPVKSK